MLPFVSLLDCVLRLECGSASLLDSGGVLVRKVGFIDESGAICQVEDLLTVRCSCWEQCRCFRWRRFWAFFNSYSSAAHRFCREFISRWVVLSTECFCVRLQVRMSRDWIHFSSVGSSVGAFKFVAFPNWFWFGVELYVSVGFFCNGKASRGSLVCYWFLSGEKV